MTLTGWTVFTVALYVLAVARLTRLINVDELTDPIRIWAARKYGPLSRPVYFLSCPWCVSMWLALLASPFPILAGHLPWWLFVPLALSASHLIGLASQVDAGEMEIEVED